jgi:uncharacterized protein
MALLDKVLVPPGQEVSFSDADELFARLQELDRPVPDRGQGRRAQHREQYCILQYLRILATFERLRYPLRLERPHEDPPDYVLHAPGGSEAVEITEATTRELQRQLDREARMEPGIIQVELVPRQEAKERWADIVFAAYRKKAEALQEGRYDLDHLLIYDGTGLALSGLLPLPIGAERLRALIDTWVEAETPSYAFRRVSILRDRALLLDILGEATLLDHQAHQEMEALDRLRRFRAQNRIRHLALFGSHSSDGEDIDPENSDLDLLVEFEPDHQVSLLDMARMEGELAEILDLKIDLRTAEDLSRYFRADVMAKAVSLDEL